MTALAHIQKQGWLFALVGVLAALLWLWAGEPARPSALSSFSTPITAVDINQGRLNAVPPSPRSGENGWHIRQDFVAGHDGLREIELILARNGEPDADEDGRFTLTLFDDAGNAISQRALFTRNFRHNHTYTFSFPAQPASAGRRYVLELSGNETNPLTVWGYDLDVIGSGQAVIVAEGEGDGPGTAVQDLRFITRYQLLPTEAFSTLASQVWRDGVIILLALLFIPLPGVVLMQLPPLRWRGWDGMAWWGAALALGTAVWPLIWYAFTLLGGHFTGWLLWLLVGVCSGVYVFTYSLFHASRITRHASRTLSSCHRATASSRRPRRPHLLLLLILTAGLAVRLLAVRDLAAPPWVDAGRHALITAVMVANGQPISDYAPYLPVDRFPYHFGFHTIAASLALMTGWPLERLLLVLGQLLNALVPLTVYTAVWLMTRRRSAAILAAFLVAIPFFFPAYYATWGRFTQLSAILVMAVLLAFTWLLVRGGARWKQSWWVVALLAAGIFYIHFRVFLFYVPFVAVLWLWSWGRHGRWLLLGGVAGLLLTLPRLFTLTTITEPVQAIGHNLPNYNEFPWSYVNSGWDRWFIGLAGLLLLPLLIGLVRRRRWAALPVVLLLWVGLLFLLLAGEYLGLPSTSLVNLNSMYITLFLPMALFLGVMLDQVWRWLRRSHWVLLVWAYVAAGVLLTAVTLFGLRQQISILNPDTILVRPADLPALAWLDAHVPADAKIAVNSWKWLGETWAGGDGGAWIVPLNQPPRTTTTPPADYIYSPALVQEVRAFNEAATAVTDWAAMDTAVWLREQGITHLFVGQRGGFLDPAALNHNPGLQLLYAADGVFIFEIED
ncbi:MAG: hypothetical protein KJ069_25755 [Anaerolineae bacterium]|nr:hypothetical protein [Anaerolineae bacterium]